MELMKGNLLSSEDCAAATKDVAVIFHLAAGTGEKSFPDAFMNSVVTTRNLLEASLRHGCTSSNCQCEFVCGLYQPEQAPWKGIG